MLQYLRNTWMWIHKFVSAKIWECSIITLLFNSIKQARPHYYPQEAGNYALNEKLYLLFVHDSDSIINARKNNSGSMIAKSVQAHFFGKTDTFLLWRVYSNSEIKLFFRLWSFIYKDVFDDSRLLSIQPHVTMWILEVSTKVEARERERETERENS